MEEELIAEVEQGHRRFRGCGCHRGRFGILSLGGAGYMRRIVTAMLLGC